MIIIRKGKNDAKSLQNHVIALNQEKESNSHQHIQTEERRLTNHKCSYNCVTHYVLIILQYYWALKYSNMHILLHPEQSQMLQIKVSAKPY